MRDRHEIPSCEYRRAAHSIRVMLKGLRAEIAASERNGKRHVAAGGKVVGCDAMAILLTDVIDDLGLKSGRHKATGDLKCTNGFTPT